MIRHIWIRIRRKPQYLIAIFLFSTVIALALCGLNSANRTAQAEYDDIYSKIRVRCTVTNLTGNQSDALDIQSGFISLFTGSRVNYPAVFRDLVEDVQIKGSAKINWNGEEYILVGITSTQAAPQLWPENGSTIFWNDGVDSSAFDSSEAFCIIPQALEKLMMERNLPTDCFDFSITPANRHETEYTGALPVIGVYAGQSENKVYCSWSTYVAILASMGRSEMADSLYATLRNNDDLELLRKTASQYFVQPNPGYAGMEVVGELVLGFDINDSQLAQAKKNLDNSTTVNKIAAILIFGLSTVAGTFIGFLVVCSRKREIALMRTMGTSDCRIYASFALEQTVFVVLGAIVGGVKFRWKPTSWLVLFVVVYFAALSVAVLTMLRRNLLTIIKEEE